MWDEPFCGLGTHGGVIFVQGCGFITHGFGCLCHGVVFHWLVVLSGVWADLPGVVGQFVPDDLGHVLDVVEDAFPVDLPAGRITVWFLAQSAYRFYVFPHPAQVVGVPPVEFQGDFCPFFRGLGEGVPEFFGVQPSGVGFLGGGFREVVC